MQKKQTGLLIMKKILISFALAKSSRSRRRAMRKGLPFGIHTPQKAKIGFLVSVNEKKIKFLGLKTKSHYPRAYGCNNKYLYC